MQKIKDFESFAAGYFSALRIKHPTANDIRNYCIESRTFAAAFSFYACNDPYVMAQETSDAKFEAVAKNFHGLEGCRIHRRTGDCCRRSHSRNMEMTAIKTADMSRDDWLEERTKGIGGSDVATVLGLNPYKTPLQLWEEKTGKSKGHEAGEAAYWGTQLEDLVAKEFSKRTGMKVQRVNFMLTAGEDGWMRGNIDRAIVNAAIAGRVSLLKADKAEECGRLLSTDMGLECKTASQFMADQWGDSQEQEILAGQVVTDHKIPLYYETQIQWYMAVTGLSKFYVAVLIGGSDFRMYEVPRDEDVIQALISQCEAFWKNNVLADVPPAPVNVEDIKKLYKKDNGEMTEATNEEAADIGELRTLKERIKELQEQEKAVASRVILAIGEKTGLLIGGAKAVTYKAMNSTRFSSTDFKKEHPDLYKDYAKTTSTRVLRLA